MGTPVMLVTTTANSITVLQFSLIIKKNHVILHVATCDHFGCVSSEMKAPLKHCFSSCTGRLCDCKIVDEQCSTNFWFKLCTFLVEIV